MAEREVIETTLGRDVTVLGTRPQGDGREEPVLDDAYRREAKVFMPGQDVQEMLVQLMKFNHHASELLLKELKG